MSTDLKITLQGLGVAMTAALVLMPGFLWIARRLGVVDRPGGRKRHERITPLLGGAGVVAATVVGYLVVAHRLEESAGLDLGFGEIRWVLAGGLVLFVLGLVDDIFKDRLPFQLKLMGQVVGVGVLMWPHLARLVVEGGAPREWLYQLFFLGWYLTVVNSFNFTDNMNGLMAGLSVIALSAAVVYLGKVDSLRTVVIAMLLIGGLLGFLPYNFPRARLFLGDAGSLFVGYWMAWVQFDVVKGFLGVGLGTDMGTHHLIPAVLIMGVPLFDAAFVVLMRAVERRPVYLGDDRHLSHRLVRGGFTPTEAVVLLWGLGCLLAGVGVFAARATPTFRYVLFGASMLLMIAITRVVMRMERVAHEGRGAAR